MIQCLACNRELPVEVQGRVMCLCGHAFSCGDPTRPVKCTYLGSAVGIADCGCSGSPKVFACGLHGLSMDRKLKPGRVRVDIEGEKSVVEMAYCNSCDDYTPADGLTYRKSIRIVTSFSPHRTDRQVACLASWRRFGVAIVAVQPAREIDAMAATYEGVEWIACEGQRPTIAELASVASDGPILLINSDIAIESTLPEFRRDWLAIEDKVLRVGCRWEIPVGGKPHLQRWGIDAFLITPEMLDDFRDAGFAIGQPAWDYWIVLHYASLGYTIRAKTDRGLLQ